MNSFSYFFRLLLVIIILIYPIYQDYKKKRFLTTSIEYFLLFFIFSFSCFFIYQIIPHLSFVLFLIFTFFYVNRFHYLEKYPKIPTDLVLIRDGKVNLKELIEGGYPLGKLIKELHQSKIKRLEDISYVVLKKEGTLSIIPKTKKISYQKTLIIEGNVLVDTLINIGKSEEWLSNMLKEKNLSLKEIFLAFYFKNQLYIICNQ